ncbi:hypothetical protein DAEQUDRAFT_762795 [Daedalea quercina L-15889]|uniref:Uncharacterized protein n=1 Tax=Daedalea quercina L-15889 TaxID=1314783 RepID=A0A165SUB8_9APHY|nr:hypothetical protein DAEQUDRAFT_762795 [Daedalea quercina L-15889]
MVLTTADVDVSDPNGVAYVRYFDTSFYVKGGKLNHYCRVADGSIAAGSSIYFWNHVQRAQVTHTAPPAWTTRRGTSRAQTRARVSIACPGTWNV